MTSRAEHISDLLSKELTGELSIEERAELDRWRQLSERHAALFDELHDGKNLSMWLARLAILDEEAAIKDLRAQFPQMPQEGIIPLDKAGHRVPSMAGGKHFLKTAWFRYAAAIIILLGIGTWFYMTNQKEKPSSSMEPSAKVDGDVLPGGNRATLTLADGSKILLDSAANGTLAKQQQALIVKDGDRVIYRTNEMKNALRETVSLNTMSTPRGGQFQLTLADGSQVWLNAESSITYPTAFTGSERKVSITGEAYFEVGKDKTKKFIVDVNGKQEVEVLGTHFNVNAYKEEPGYNTTLLEGSVRIKAVHTSLTLKPGQQGQLNDQKLVLAKDPDIEQVMAWKNGAFDFRKVSLEVALREIARWYDVEVIYTNGIPEVTLGGGMGRDLNLSQVLKVLEGVGVKARLDQKRLYISK